MPKTVEAAGGVLWRPADRRLDAEVALVHRPGRDDWSLPKGKLREGEHPILGAQREVWEETGYRSAVGPALGTTRYQHRSGPKRVRYWTLRAQEGSFRPSAEIDDLVWLPPDAAARLVRDRDRPIVRAFINGDPHHASPLLLVRSGKAVPPGRWSGPERERPLASKGHERAKALAGVLRGYGVERLLAANLRRCRQTLRPLSSQCRVDVEDGALLEPGTGRRRRREAVEHLLDLARADQPTAVCAESDVLARLLVDLNTVLGHRPPARVPSEADFYAVHLRRSGPAKVAAFEAVAATG
jgi:8-oxo-dGTP diphosphatase